MINSRIEVKLETYLWGTACVGSDILEDYDAQYYYDSCSYAIMEGILVFGVSEEEDMPVDFALTLTDEDSFIEFQAPDGLREITDPTNDILYFRGATKVGPYVVLQDGFSEEDPGFSVVGYDQARFRAFGNESLDCFEVILLLGQANG